MRLSSPPPSTHLGVRVQQLCRALFALSSGAGQQARQFIFGLARPEPLQNTPGGRPPGGPPDMEELWRDFNRKIGSLFNLPPKLPGDPPKTPSPNGAKPPNLPHAGLGLGLLAGLVALVWAASGFFIVNEGEQAIVTAFGQYSRKVDAGLSWRFPYPFQSHETVLFTQPRTIEIGRNTVSTATGLRESSMLTQDENIVDIRFTVQYRLKDAQEYLYQNHRPDEAVVKAAESAVREIVGRSTMDSVLYEQREAIASDLHKLLQAQLDVLRTGISVVNVSVSGVQAPEQVQAAFDDAFRATADRERLKNQGQAHANKIIPEAQGKASRLREQAEGYKARVIATAQGDAQRFTQVFAEYQKAPTVTRDRLYIDGMRQMYANITKVMVDTKSNSNMLYLPIDKLMAQSGASSVGATPAGEMSPASAPTGAMVSVPPPTASVAAPTAALPAAPASTTESRSRDGQRSRDRDVR
jgi:modulator of FtsH protease HflK